MDAPNVEVRRELQPAVQLHLARAPGVDVEDLRKAGLVRVKQGPNLHARREVPARAPRHLCQAHLFLLLVVRIDRLDA